MTKKEAAKKISALKKGESKTDQKWLDGLANLVEDGDWKKAHKHLKGGDTFMRDIIPDDVGHYIEVQAAGGERVITAKIVLNGVKKVFNAKLGPGVLGTVELAFPKGTPEERIAMAIVTQNEKVINSLLHVEYVDEDGTTIAKMP